MREEYEKLLGDIDQTGARTARLEHYHEAQMAYFKKFDSLLDSCASGPRWLGDPMIAKIVSDAILFRDARCFTLSAFCIMPNHIHLIVDTANEPNPQQEGPQPGSLTDMLASLKSYTAHEANRLLNRSGAFWQHESYDHVIRDSDELEALLWYVLLNPVKAGFASSWQEWPWTYCREGLL